jgi:hypothetical protein
MPLKFSANPRSAQSLNFTANRSAGMSSVASLAWANVSGKPNVLLYDVQGLTGDQQEQAQDNIGLKPKDAIEIISIGSSGADYTSWQAAIDDLYKHTLKGNIRFNLQYLTGEEIEDGVFVRDGDYSRFYLTYQGDGGTPGASTIALATGFSGVSDVGLPMSNSKTDNVIMGHNAQMPLLMCKIDAEHRGDTGYYLAGGGSGYVWEDCGVINAGYSGLEARSGHVTAYKTIWNGANASGIRAAHGAVVAAQQALANQCCQTPDSNELGALDISRLAVLHFREGEANESGACGFNVRRASTLCCEEAEFNDSTYVGGYCVHGSLVDGWGMEIERTKGVALDTSSGHGLVVESLGRVVAFGSSIQDNGTIQTSASDIYFADNGMGGGHVILTNAVTTSGSTLSNSIQDTNLDNFNVPYARGMVTYGEISGPFHNIGRFSDTGATNGAEWTTSSIFRSSRTATTAARHAGYYNPNGLVGSISTFSNSTRFIPTSDVDVWYSAGSGSPEGSIAADIGAIYVDTATGFMYRKTTNTANTGWVAVNELFADVTITTGELLALNGTPKQLVAAPGANLAIILHRLILFLDYNSVAYNGIAAGEDIAIRYTDGSGTIVATCETDPFLTATADATRIVYPYRAASGASDVTPTANAALVAHMTTSNIATGNSPLLTRTYYSIVPTTL